jgi:hypothetical protein
VKAVLLTPLPYSRPEGHRGPLELMDRLRPDVALVRRIRGMEDGHSRIRERRPVQRRRREPHRGRRVRAHSHRIHRSGHPADPRRAAGIGSHFTAEEDIPNGPAVIILGTTSGGAASARTHRSSAGRSR